VLVPGLTDAHRRDLFRATSIYLLVIVPFAAWDFWRGSSVVVPSASLLSAIPCITAFHKFGNLAFSQSNRVIVRAAFHVLGVAIPGLATYLLGIYGFAVTLALTYLLIGILPRREDPLW
jgi:hypothetical protein